MCIWRNYRDMLLGNIHMRIKNSTKNYMAHTRPIALHQSSVFNLAKSRGHPVIGLLSCESKLDTQGFVSLIDYRCSFPS